MFSENLYQLSGYGFHWGLTKSVTCRTNTQMRSALFLDIMLRILVVTYRRFENISWPLKKGPIGCPETWVRNYHSTLHNNPVERRCHTLRSWTVNSSENVSIVHVPTKILSRASIFFLLLLLILQIMDQYSRGFFQWATIFAIQSLHAR
jgi:hypothetical protein